MLLFSGCGAPPPKPPPPPPPPTIVQATVAADVGVNPDTRGRASPVVVRVLELKTLAAFESADFFSLFDRDKDILGAELVAREELQMQPGEKKTLQRTLPPETKYLGVVAAFRDLERARWRASIPVVPNQTTPLTIKVDPRAVSISTNK